MKKLIITMLIAMCTVTFANDKQVEVGMKASYFHFGLMERIVGEILAVYDDGKVLVHKNLKEVKKIKKIGIEVESGCLNNICVGDSVKYKNVWANEYYTSEVVNVFDNDTVQLRIGSNSDYVIKTIKNVSKKL